MNISQLAKFISFLTVLIIIWTEAFGANTDYTEFEFGDASTPLIALGREVLSSNDVLECSPSNTAHINPYVFLNSLGLYPIDQTQKQPLTQSRQNQNFDNLLIGFPITALSKRMAIGAVITHISDPSNFEDPYAKALPYYKFGRVPVKELQPKLIASKEGKCLLTFDTCFHRWSCRPENSRGTFLQIPILGISKKHRALIFDPQQLGTGLEKTRKLQSGFTFLPGQRIRSLDIKEPKTSIIDFVDSTLIFDIDGKIKWSFKPQIILRWFLKFDLVGSEEGFQSRPPTKGVGYFLNTLYEPLSGVVNEIPKRIIRHRIFKNGQVQPVKYYVKNVPEQYQLAFQRAFEYWQSIFTSLISHPILLYEFLQGDFDKDGQEILTGDVRFNIIEWENGLEERNNKGNSFQLSNQTTGEIWSAYSIIYGDYLVNAHQKRFQYSQLVRESLSSASYNNLENRFIQINLFNQLTGLLQVKPHFFLPLNRDNENFESYILGLIEHLASHEIGHTIGLGHNYNGSIFANDTYAANTKMDTLSNIDGHKKTSDDYDKMAIGYSYLEILPKRTDMFCEYAVNRYYHAVPMSKKSPECAAGDSSSNPLQFAASELREIVDLLTTRSLIQHRPYLIWKGVIHTYIGGLFDRILSYYFLADTHYDQLQTVLIDGRKPQNPQEVKDVVLKILKSFTCDPELLDIFNRAERINPEPDNFDQHLHRNVVRFFGAFNWFVRMDTDISLSDLHSCS